MRDEPQPIIIATRIRMIDSSKPSPEMEKEVPNTVAACVTTSESFHTSKAEKIKANTAPIKPRINPQLSYLSRQDSLVEFRSWSGFSSALDMLEENPLPAVAIVTPVMEPSDQQLMVNLRDSVAKIPGVDEVRMS